MRLKWGNEKIKGFSDPIKKAEEVNWLVKLLDDYFMWFVIVIMAGATIWIMIKIIQIYQIEVWLKNI